jgi:peptide-methionine (S)-S-oxide reductase
LNRQGHDVGTQYRSAIFYHSPEQEAAARAAVQKLQPHFATPIVTDIQPAGPFYVADAHHQDYYRNNKSQGYCQLVIRPKLEKLGLQK